MDLRYPLPGPRGDFGRAKRIAGVLAVLVGFLMGFTALLLLRLAPVFAALITTFDVMVGVCFYWSGYRQQKREAIERRFTGPSEISS
ncbi:MAG: hypothetical protein ABI383_06345 [Acidobacteriaceae bacterium]